jgi:hypothetical protein
MIKEAHDLNPEERAAHKKRYGGYNDFPPNWKRCAPEDFWGTFVGGCPRLVEFRQMLEPKSVFNKLPKNTYGQRTVRNAKLYFYNDGTGLALVSDYDYAKSQHRKPLLYKFAACEHEYEGVPEKSAMCYHVSRCKKCGYEYAVDSSD